MKLKEISVSIENSPARLIEVTEALGKAARDTIGKPGGEICSPDLLRLWTLGAVGLDISDITALEYCTNLILLALSGNQVSGFTPLSGLVSLETFSVGSKQISHIEPLSGLVNLWILYLDSNHISDLSPLVLNPGIDGYVDVRGNPLSPTSCTVHIPTLEARGVFVDHDCR